MIKEISELKHQDPQLAQKVVHSASPSNGEVNILKTQLLDIWRDVCKRRLLVISYYNISGKVGALQDSDAYTP